MLNIPSHILDPNYRYKMPKMVLKIQGKGNGIKTNITNLVDVAQALRTDSEYILKFFGFEKASQITYKQISKNDITCIINGSFSDDDMLKVLDKFIEKYIICPKCKYPEMHMQVKKGKVIGQCDSCGFNGDLDNVNRVAQFIIKKPPKQRKQMGKKVEIIKQQKGKVEQVNKEGKKKKLGKEQLQIKSELLEDILVRLRTVFSTNTQNDKSLIVAELTNQLKQCGIEKSLTDRFAYLIFNTLFTINIYKQIKDMSPIYVSLFKKFNITNPEAQTLLNFEYLFLEKQKDQEKSLKSIPTILKLFYDEELLSEEFFKKWSSGQLNAQISNHFLYERQRDQTFKNYAKPFLDWINEVEEEEQERQN